MQAHDRGRHQGDRRELRGRRPPGARGGPRRRRAARRERLPHHAVPELRDQRSHGRVRRAAREPRALRDRDRQSDPGPGGERLPPADEDQRRGPQQRAVRPQEREAGQHRDRVDPGLQVADRGGRGQRARLHRQLVSAPPQPVRLRVPGGHLRRHVRAAGLERHQHAAEPAAVPQQRRRRRLQQAVAGRGRAGGPDRRPDASGLEARQAGDHGAGHLHGRVPDGLRHPPGHLERRLRRRQHREAARGQQRSGEPVRRRTRQGGEALHLLQQVPRARRRAPAGVLRGEPLREPRGDDGAGDVGVSSAAVLNKQK